MKAEQLIIDNLNRMQFCVKHNIVFYDYFKVNNLSYPKNSRGLSLITNDIFNKRKLSFSANFTNLDCTIDIIFSAEMESSFLLSHYFEKVNPNAINELTIRDYNLNSEIKFDTFFEFLNNVFYSEEIYKMITTKYWTNKYYVDMWGNYK